MTKKGMTLRSKLYLTVGITLALVVGLLTYEFTSNTTTILFRSMEQTVATSVESTAATVKARLDGYRILLRSSVPSGVISRSRLRSSFGQIVSSSSDFIAMHSVSTDSKFPRVSYKTSQLSDPSFSGKKAAEVVQSLLSKSQNRATKNLKNPKRRSVEVHNWAPSTDLPILEVSAPFRYGSKQVTVTLLFWARHLIADLPESPGLASVIIGPAGNALAWSGTRRPGHIVKQSKRLFQNKSNRQNQYTASRRFVSKSGKSDRQVAATRMPDYELQIAASKDLRPSVAIIESMVNRLLHWGLLYFLIFVFIGFFVAKRLTDRLLEIARGTGKIAKGKFDVRFRLQSNDEIGYLARAVTHMGRQLHELINLRVKTAEREKELQTAKMVQSHIYPKTQHETTYCEIQAHCWPATECGGDLWGHFKDRVGCQYLVFGDATGHGVPAALVASMAYAAYVSVIQMLKSSARPSWHPEELIQIMNTVLWEAGHGETTMTCMLAKLDPFNKTMDWVNAGHTFPFLILEDANDPRAQKKRARRRSRDLLPLMGGGSPLGYEKDIRLKRRTIELKSSDKLVFYSDGIVECTAKDGKVWGTPGLRERLERYKAADAEKLLKSVAREFSDFNEEKEREDDITLMVVGMREAWDSANPVVTLDDEKAS